MIKKINYFTFIAVLVVLLMTTLSIFIIPLCLGKQVYAEENGIEDFIEYSSLYVNIIANKKNIGTVRLNSYLHLKANGDGMMMIEGKVDPKINDGSDDYMVKCFTLDTYINDDFDTMNSITVMNNATEKIETITNGSSVIINSDGMSFNISNTASITYNTTSLRANYSNLEPLPGVMQIDKSIYIEPIKSNKDTSYYFTNIYFFKFQPHPQNNIVYRLYLKELQVDGIVFAPDYGINNNEQLRIQGFGALDGRRMIAGIVNTSDKNDGSPNDTLEEITFNSIIL